MKAGIYQSRSTSLYFFDAWEELSKDQRETEIQKKLSTFMEYARSAAPFYKTRLDGFSKDASQPLGGVPILTAAEVRQVSLPNSREILANGIDTCNVFQSGGTT